MGIFRKPDEVSTREIKALDGLKPLEDKVFTYLLEQAVAGVIPVYYGAVPFIMIRPFDEGYRPEAHPVGKAAVDAIIQDWSEGKFQKVWVYPKGNHFILSDDYIVYAAAQQGQPDYLPCWILGKPEGPAVKDVQGPIAKNDLLRLLGFSE